MWVTFLLRFDVRYRQRRVRFVIRAVNELYTRLNEPAFADMTTEQLDNIKAGLYDLLGRLRPMAGRHTVAPDLREAEGPQPGAFSTASIAALKSVIHDVVASAGDACRGRPIPS